MGGDLHAPYGQVLYAPLPSVVKLSYSLCVYIGIVICHKAMYIL